MQSTRIVGPFDTVDYDDKVAVQCRVPETYYQKWFKSIFIRKGAQDKIVANLLEIFFERCRRAGLTETYDSRNEKIAQKVLNEMQQELSIK